MRIFYDFEFLENGHTIEPISIGMVADDGRELYAVFEEIDESPLHERICGHHWLMSEVVPLLPIQQGTPVVLPGPRNVYPFTLGSFRLDLHDNTVMPRRMIRNAVRDFIDWTDAPELWAWYGAYDHVSYAQLFGKMLDLPEGFPMHTNDIKTLYQMAGNPPAPDQVGGEHNALADARHDKIRYDHVTRLLTWSLNSTGEVTT